MKRVITLIFFCLFPVMVHAQYKGETVRIPMVDEGLLWDTDITLEATLYKPEGDGPFPVVIFNHGSTGPGIIPEDVTINPWGLVAIYLKKISHCSFLCEEGEEHLMEAMMNNIRAIRKESLRVLSMHWNHLMPHLVI